METNTNGQMPQKIVIVGGVAVGATDASWLHRLSEITTIVLFEKGPHISFANSGFGFGGQELRAITPATAANNNF